MNTSIELMMRTLLCGFCGLLLAWVVWDRYHADSEGSASTTSLTGKRVRYQPYINAALLPAFLLTMGITGLIILGAQYTAKLLLSLCFHIFLHICLYYLLLMPLLPFLRRHFSARACATLWLLPNFLYLMFQSGMKAPQPLLVIPVPGRTVWFLFWVWLAGFATVMAWKTIQHLLFRRSILFGSQRISDHEVWKVWNKEMEDAGLMDKKYDLVISPHVHTPLTIGLYRRTTKVVLPERSYTPEELSLIFRHEIIHIARGDAWNKFFLVFCTAMCWFNPLMWQAMRKSAEDLELSCDETVLLGVDDATRKQYAALLLDTVGDGRGYTTCLAASADALRYRLKSVIHPRKRRCGALLIGLTFFLLSYSCGYVALAYGNLTGEDVLYSVPGTYTASSISMTENDIYTSCYAPDEEALHAYLASLPLLELTGNYAFSESNRTFECSLYTPDNFTWFVLQDDILLFQPLRNPGVSGAYQIPGGVDWERLRSLTMPKPQLWVELSHPTDGGRGRIGAYLHKVWRIKDGERTLFYDDPLGDGVHCSALWSEVRGCRATLSFSETPATPYHIVVQDRQLQEVCTMEQAAIGPKFTFTPIDQYARYVISTAYIGQDGTQYEVEYIFDAGAIG